MADIWKKGKLWFRKLFHTKEFAKYVVVGLFITVLGAVLSTVAGVMFHQDPTMLFLINLILINGVLFLLKYILSYFWGIIKR